MVKKLNTNRIKGLSLADVLKSKLMCCWHHHNIKARRATIISFFKVIEYKFDWNNFLKLQIEHMLIKAVFLSKEQNEVISIISKMNLFDNNINVF